MPKFIIEPHFRLQEWVAEEKGYFARRRPRLRVSRAHPRHRRRPSRRSGKVGAFQSIEQGREANVTCACHWTVNVAASRGHTKLYADAYSVAPCGIFVPANSPILAGPAGRRADLGWLPVGQPLRHPAGAGAVLARRADQAFLWRGHAVWPHASLPRGRRARLHAFQRPLLLRRAAWASAKSSTPLS